jgi:4-amino-4-deoxy-L-arabinose transferase-like glycosyltransferase
MLEAISIWLFGLTPWVLRIVPALIGVGAVVTTYLWAKAWFGERPAVLTAFLLAITPWSVTISRNVEPAALGPLLLTLLLWLATRVWHDRSTRNVASLAAVILIASLSGPVGWGALLVTLAASLAVAIKHETRPKASDVGIWLGLTVAAVLPALVVILRHKHNGRTIFSSNSFSDYVGGFMNTIRALPLHGDDNYYHNLGGVPLINAFITIVFLAGLLVVATHWKNRTRRALLVASAVALLPALIAPATAPDAARLILMLPLSLAFASIGVFYMLGVWYATFPINSAARLTGQLLMLILLILTLYLSYLQYFVAWSQSSDTHRAYGDTAIGMASWIKQQPAGQNPIVVIDSDDAAVLQYVLIKAPTYQAVSVTSAGALLPQRPLHLIIAAPYLDQLVAQLKTTAPGATLQSHQSSFDGADLYYTYDLP